VKTPNFTAERLRELLHYDPETGLFTREKSSQGAKAGVAGVVRKDGYCLVCVLGRQYLLHRLAWFYVTGKWPTDLIDHIDGNPSNNRFSNLREATKITNAQNIKGPPQHNTSGLIGATQIKATGRWRAEIRVDGGEKSWHLGIFPNAEQAHAAYIEAKRKLHEGCTL
jgi:hypothetical protein